MTQGTIVSLAFGAYLVHVDGETYRMTMPKTDKIKLTPVVGDRVMVDLELHHILSLLPRTAFVKRPRLANLSHLLIVASLGEPTFSFHLLALFISFARFYNLGVTIIITKTDRFERSPYQNYWDYLTEAGFPVLFFSKHNPEDIKAIDQAIPEGKIVAFAGQTGAGKSSIINQLNPQYERQIGTYSVALGRGRHQTKEVILLPYRHGFIADTPGFSSLELPMLRQDLAKVFPGFEPLFSQCKFFNCTHEHEPGCSILQAVNRGKIPLEIYQDYIKVLEKLPHQKEYQ